MNIDLFLFSNINTLAYQFKALDLLGIFLAEYLPYVLGAILVIALFWPKHRRQQNRPMVVIGVTAALVARLVVKIVIISFYGRPRPFVILPQAHKLIAISAGENFQSFPSGHALLFFALSTVLYCFNKKLGTWFFAASTLMGIARVFVGVHWPSDILGGVVIGVGTGWLTYQWYRRYQARIDTLVNKSFEKLGL